MMALSTKLALLVLLLPISIVAILDAITYYVYGTLTIEASNLLSSILVFLLVWERLRESLATKLKYLNENVFLSLYSELETGQLFWKQDAIEKAKNDLQKHGKFLNIALYSHSLIKKLSAFLQLHGSFYEKEEQLLNIAQKMLGTEPNRRTLMSFLGIGISYSQPSQQEALAYSTTAMSMQREQSQLIKEAKTTFEKIKAKRKRIFEEFEEFLKQNNLKLKPEPVRVVSSFG